MTATAGTPALVCEGLQLRFGGIQALDDVSLRVEPGEIVGLIGMNGAGKSTLLNCVSGMTGVDGGAITAYGVDVTHAPADFRADLGIARTFQGGKLFPTMTVLENVELALERQHVTSTFTAMLGLPWGRQAERWKEGEAQRLLGLIGLSAFADKFVRELSTGTRRIVELAALLAQRPRLILMDEPAAGVAQRETEVLVLLLQQLRDELDCAIVLVEHDMPLVMAVCDHVYAMEAGRVIAEGPPLDVQTNPLVVASYLGEDGAAIARSDSAPTAPRTRARSGAGDAPGAPGAPDAQGTPDAPAAVPPSPARPHGGHAGRKSLVLAAPALALALFAAVLSSRAPSSGRPVAETAHQARAKATTTTTTTTSTTTLALVAPLVPVPVTA
ncbi:MAG TPA: ABC transporter ATP-binding protein, partial [Acidimicrobiales bacterium]|nr:ABC transporter ATP-binding protein [Acidimicrobiales bacterium]